MEEDEGTQICPNCNREIPKVNFVTHSLHCVRNIKVCPVCKEPVPQNELDEHNEKLHQLAPCGQCGEMVCGTDMEDHTRDSCAFTMQTCRFCALELRRRDVPSHERYCGARTERCAECAEYVMLRYRQLHLDSNHGFVRLHEDPPPRSAVSVSADSTTSRPANSRPRFPPYVSVRSVINPSISEEESLRLIAQIRARNSDTKDSFRRSDVDFRLRLMAALPLPLHFRGGDDRVPHDDGMSLLSERQRLIANLRGVPRARETMERDAVEQNALRHHAAIRNAVPRNVVEHDAVRRNIFGRNVVARNAVVPDVVEQNAVAPNAVVENGVAPNAVVENGVAPNAVEENGVAPNAVEENGVAPNAVEQNAEGHDEVTRNATRQDVVVRNAVAPDAVDQNAVASNAIEQNAVSPNVRDAVELVAEVKEAEVRDEAAAVAEAREAESKEVIDSQPRPRPSAGSRTRSNYRVILKRTNDQPQINTTVTVQDKITKKLGARGAVKKRPAPAAPAPFPTPSPDTPPASSVPAPAPAPDPKRDLPYYSALQRRQTEDRRRLEQTSYNLSVGLPPVLDPAAKLEKLRKMDALHNREDEAPDYRQRLQGRVWRDNNNVPAGHTAGRGGINNTTYSEQQRRELSNLQPMSADEFMERFNELQLIKEPRDIRSSLRELRRGLNEVTAPYNNNASSNNNNNNNNSANKNNNIIEDSLNKMLQQAGIPDIIQLDEARALDASERSPETDVLVPCEFCYEPLRAVDILDHERECRHGLIGARRPAASPNTPVTGTSPPRPQSPWDDENIPIIPCEFCTETLPYYLINEHQELCGRESNLLYPD